MCMRVKRWMTVSQARRAMDPSHPARRVLTDLLRYFVVFVAIKEDGGDPDFLKNLSRLGQVAVPKPGTPFEKASPAISNRVVSSRRFLTDISTFFDKTASTCTPDSHVSNSHIDLLSCTSSKPPLRGLPLQPAGPTEIPTCQRERYTVPGRIIAL
jgi:hypothetical protein